MKIIISLIFCCTWLSNLQTDYEKQIQGWQNEINAAYADEEQSPLDKKALRKFKGLEFFPINQKYRIEAKLIRTPNALPISVRTSQGGQQIYDKYGIAEFVLDGVEISIPIYQNNLAKLEDEKSDYLFLPFNDDTNGLETYGGGRYLDLQVPSGETIILDFNKAYSPACAYNENYICPVPPRDNFIPVPIKAGVLAWEY